MKKYLFLLLVGLIPFSPIESEKGRSIANADKNISHLNFRRSYLSTVDTQLFKGLIHNKSIDDSEYMRRLFGSIVQKAHEVSNEDWYHPEKNLFRNYNTFLLLSLVVPQHESNLMHFTYRNTQKYCYFSNNVIDPVSINDKPSERHAQELASLNESLKTADRKAKKSIQEKIRKINVVLNNEKLLKKGYDVFRKNIGPNVFQVFNCSKITDENVHQLFFANDYADVGLFMFNASSHGEFFEKGGIFDTDKVIDYALNFLYKDGFHRIAHNSSLYSCLKGLERKDPIKYATYLIRGAWAGKYNSGKTRNTCRFMNPAHRHSRNDVNFKNSLEKFFKPTPGFISLFQKLLPEDSIERKAFFEIVDNVKRQVNNRENIEKVLNTNYKIDLSDQDEKLELTDETHEAVIPLEIDESITTTTEDIIEDNNEVNEVIIDTPIVQINEETVLTPTMDEIKEVPNELPIIEVDEEQVSIEELESTPVRFDIEYKPIRYVRYYIDSKLANIRSHKKTANEFECGNTRKSKVFPITVEKVKRDDMWYVISRNGIEDLLYKNKCDQLEEYYVYHTLVKTIEDRSVLHKIELKSWVSMRDDFSKEKGQIIGNVGPGTYYLIQTKILQDKYIWVQFLSEDGVKAWFYGGTTEKQKFELLNEK